MPKYYVPGKGEVTLGKSDFLAQGGQGSVYVRNSIAYKIFSDPQSMISVQKLNELAALSEPNIIRPLDLLLDHRNLPVGYTMRHVADAYSLCQLFPRAFRDRNNLTPELVLKLVQQMQTGVGHVHNHGVLIVDLNEMNFLTSRDFDEIFFIDVDSYQTPSFPAKALMESVRDRHATRFTKESDWFSFAVISFQMFVGIHPFKGNYPALRGCTDKSKLLDARMKANISVLHPGVSVPASCLPFNSIPGAYYDWYHAVFEEGKRLAPPRNAIPSIVTSFRTQCRIESVHFEISELHEYESDILRVDGPITTTAIRIYNGSRTSFPSPGNSISLISPRLGHMIVAYYEHGSVHFRDLTAAKEIETDLEATNVMQIGGRVYVQQRGSLLEIAFAELAGTLRLSSMVVANVNQHSTRLFDGVLFQNLLGACYASVIPTPGTCYQIRLPELDKYRIIDARIERGVLVVLGNIGGNYDRLIFRFSKAFDSYDLRVSTDVTLTGINFTVLDNGTVLHLTDNDELELFPAVKGATTIRTLVDQTLAGGIKLFNKGNQALFARGNKLYAFAMRTP